MVVDSYHRRPIIVRPCSGGGLVVDFFEYHGVVATTNMNLNEGRFIMNFQTKILHEEPQASELREAYAIWFKYDICEAMTCAEDYLPLIGHPKHPPLPGHPEQYTWSREHLVTPVRSDTVSTRIDCRNNVMGTSRKGFARILHKIRCDNILIEAHALASKLEPYSEGPLTMEDVLSAKNRLQTHAPGLTMNLHLDLESFNNIRTSPGVYLAHRSYDEASYDAYRGSIEAEGEEFKIHLWVAPSSLTQRGFRTVNFMTTHGGILFQEYPHPFIATENVNSWCKDGSTAIILGNIVVLHTHESCADDPCYYMHQMFSMTIGDENAIIRLP